MSRRATRPSIEPVSAFRARAYWVLVLPAVLLLCSLTIYPSFYTFTASLFSWNLANPEARRLVWLGNFVRILRSPQFWGAVRNTALFTAYSVTAQLVLGLVLALGFDRLGRKGAVLATLLVLPMMVPEIVAALTWQLLYNPAYGPISQILRSVGVYTFPVILGDERTALAGVAAVDVWRNTPFVVLVLLAGLRAISADFYETAAIEGAGPWQVFRFVVLPFLRPFILTAVLFRGADAFKAFDVIYVLTRGGPGSATETLAYHTFRQGFGFFEIGYASALSLIMLFVAVWLGNGILAVGARERKAWGAQAPAGR